MKKLIFKIARFISLALIVSIAFTACDKDDPKTTDSGGGSGTGTESKYLFQIENGAQTINLSSDGSNRNVQSINYSAIILDESLSVTAVSPSWSTDNSDVIEISSGGAITVKAAGVANITASIEYEGETLTASVPLNVQIPTLFAVAPSAILDFENEEIQLEPVFFSTNAQNPSYTYSSNSNSVATVDGNGLVKCVSNGSCVITITSNIQGNPSVSVPVMVVGIPDVELPVTKVTLNKSATDLLKSETFQFSAKAYNPEGEVTGKTFTWTSLNTSIVTIDNGGLVSPVSSGITYIKATCDGVFATAEVMVYPDTIVIVTPFYAEVAAGQDLQFTAKAYKTSRTSLTEYPSVDFQWMVPDYGPGFEMFNIGTVDQTGLFTMKPEAMMGNSTFVIATVPGNVSATGGAMVMVDMGF